MDSTTNTDPVATVRRIYELMADRDVDALFKLVHTDVVITQEEALPWGGTFRGHDGMAQFALALMGAIESQVTIEAIFEAGEHVVQYGRTAGTVRDTGTVFDIPECHVWTIRDGLAVEANFYIDTPAMLEALRS